MLRLSLILVQMLFKLRLNPFMFDKGRNLEYLEESKIKLWRLEVEGKWWRRRRGGGKHMGVGDMCQRHGLVWSITYQIQHQPLTERDNQINDSIFTILFLDQLYSVHSSVSLFLSFFPFLFSPFNVLLEGKKEKGKVL